MRSGVSILEHYSPQRDENNYSTTNGQEYNNNRYKNLHKYDIQANVDFNKLKKSSIVWGITPNSEVYQTSNSQNYQIKELSPPNLIKKGLKNLESLQFSGHQAHLPNFTNQYSNQDSALQQLQKNIHQQSQKQHQEFENNSSKIEYINNPEDFSYQKYTQWNPLQLKSNENQSKSTKGKKSYKTNLSTLSLGKDEVSYMSEAKQQLGKKEMGYVPIPQIQSIYKKEEKKIETESSVQNNQQIFTENSLIQNNQSKSPSVQQLQQNLVQNKLQKELIEKQINEQRNSQILNLSQNQNNNIANNHINSYRENYQKVNNGVENNLVNNSILQSKSLENLQQNNLQNQVKESSSTQNILNQLSQNNGQKPSFMPSPFMPLSQYEYYNRMRKFLGNDGQAQQGNIFSRAANSNLKNNGNFKNFY